MLKARRIFCALLFLLPHSVVTAQDPTVETVPKQSVVTDRISVVVLKHSNANVVEAALGKLFDSQTKTGQLAIATDTRSSRIYVRSNDELLAKVIEVIKELDIESEQPVPRLASPPTASSSPSMSQDFFAPQFSSDHQTQLRLLKEINDANDPSKVKSLRESLAAAVQREFELQQTELRSELSALRTKIESLESLLEKRSAQMNEICLKRVEALLSGQALAQWKPANQDPMLLNPLLSNQNSLFAKEGDVRRTPIRTNTSLDQDTINETKTTKLQCELSSEADLKIILKGKPVPLSNSPLLLQLDNRTGRVAYELWSVDGKQIAASIQLECEKADEAIWERIFGQNIRLNISKDEFDRVAGGQLITKAVYLPSESGKGQVTLVSYMEEPGTDVRVKAKQLGQPIVTMVLFRSASDPGWGHSYRAGSSDVKSFDRPGKNQTEEGKK